MKNAFIFCGQGSQSKVAFERLALHDSNTYQSQLDIISDAVGFDVVKFSTTASIDDFNNVRYTQIMVLVLNIAYYEIAKNSGFYPDVVAGHSIGQYCALYASGVINDLWNLASLINQRAALMSEIRSKGKLCAVKAPYSLDLQAIKALCKKISTSGEEYIDIALYNSDKQVVVGGTEHSINIFQILVKQIDNYYSSSILNVGQAFHTHLLDPMVLRFELSLKEMNLFPPDIPIILNTTGDYYCGENLKMELLNHCIMPVQWMATMQKIVAINDVTIFEIGAGHILSGFFRNSYKNKVIVLDDKKSITQLIKTRVAVR